VPPILLPLVEGQSEVAGLPILLRRLLLHLGHPHVLVARPFRVHRTRVSQGGEIERAVLQGLRTRERVNQPAFAGKIDLVMALERCPSLQRFALGLRSMLVVADEEPPSE
jgi:hypothetical protein